MEIIHTARRIAVLSFALIICSLISNVYANAQNLPPGSYKDTCRSISVLGGTLTAQCQKVDGTWKTTAIQYHDCEGGITNENGNLTCKHGTKPKPDKQLPKGSYKQSCKDAYVDGKWLYAKCQKKNGSWYSTSIKYADCYKDISNQNGELTCGGGGGGGNLPKGSYKETCKNIYVEGNILEADCLNRNGKYSHTSIKYKNCNRGVWNNKGVLECN